MPERPGPPYEIAKSLGGVSLDEIMKAESGLEIGCAKCGRITQWRSAHIARYLGRYLDWRIECVAARLRCAHCRSKHVKVRLWKGG